jgi:hypothetical protein
MVIATIYDFYNTRQDKIVPEEQKNDTLVMRVDHELELGQLRGRAGRRQTPLDADPGRRASTVGEDGIEQDARRLISGCTARELDEKTLGNKVS